MKNMKGVEMKIYRKRKNGFIETINTVGSYCPPGWSKSYHAANKKK